MRKKELLTDLELKDQKIEELTRRLYDAEAKIQSLQETVESGHAREQSVTDALLMAEESGKRIRSEASAEAEETLTAARQQAKATVTEAEAEAERILAEAKRRAEDLIARAETGAQEYTESVTGYNAVLKQAAAEAEAWTARFAEYCKGSSLEVPSLEDLKALVNSTPERELPDASENPAQLMQNIYTLQGRPAPEEETEEETPEEPEEEAAPDEETADGEEAPQQAAEDEDAPVPTVAELLTELPAEEEKIPLAPEGEEQVLNDLFEEISQQGEWNNGKE